MSPSPQTRQSCLRSARNCSITQLIWGGGVGKMDPCFGGLKGSQRETSNFEAPPYFDTHMQALLSFWFFRNVQNFCILVPAHISSGKNNKNNTNGLTTRQQHNKTKSNAKAAMLLFFVLLMLPPLPLALPPLPLPLSIRIPLQTANC